MGSESSWRGKNYEYHRKNTMKTEGKGEYDMEDERSMEIGTTKGTKWEENVDEDGRNNSAGPTVMRQVNG